MSDCQLLRRGKDARSTVSFPTLARTFHSQQKLRASREGSATRRKRWLPAKISRLLHGRIRVSALPPL